MLQYDGCFKVPKYGPKEGPSHFCKDHKRAGMYTFRKGQLLMATRDGRGERARVQFWQSAHTWF